MIKIEMNYMHNISYTYTETHNKYPKISAFYGL